MQKSLVKTRKMLDIKGINLAQEIGMPPTEMALRISEMLPSSWPYLGNLLKVFKDLQVAAQHQIGGSGF